MNDVENITRAVTAMHGRCRHFGTVAVKEEFNGTSVWDGEVEIFELLAHPKAKQAYAWSYRDDAGETQYTAVLAIPPVITPNDAVRAAIVAEYKNNQRKG